MRHQIIILVAAILFRIADASACSADPSFTDEQKFACAKSVFTGHIVQTKEKSVSEEGGFIIEAIVNTVEVIKGSVPSKVKITGRDYQGVNCSIPLLAGSDYLFFLYKYNIDGDSFVSWPGGSRGPISLKEDRQDPETRDLLRKLRQWRDAPNTNCRFPF